MEETRRRLPTESKRTLITMLATGSVIAILGGYAGANIGHTISGRTKTDVNADLQTGQLLPDSCRDVLILLNNDNKPLEQYTSGCKDVKPARVTAGESAINRLREDQSGGKVYETDADARNHNAIQGGIIGTVLGVGFAANAGLIVMTDPVRRTTTRKK